MSNHAFVLSVASLMILYIGAGLRFFPGESRQILACLPVRKRLDENWDGLNLTWYGALCANGIVAATALFFVLSASAGVSAKTMFFVCSVVLLPTLPAGRLVAFFVEGRRDTFTTGGASFVGAVIAAPSIMAVWRMSGQGGPVPVAPLLAALATAYAAGEALGRIACVSFGCCYGRKVEDFPRPFRGALSAIGITFRGMMKKASYAGGMEGIELVPIQGITACVYGTASVAGVALFLRGDYTWSLLLSGVAIFGWRVLSEFFRADFRGFSSFTAYQKMSLAAVAGLIVLAPLLPNYTTAPVITAEVLFGVVSVPFVLFIQVVWLTVFVYMGRSTVTGSRISMFVRK